MELYFLHSFCSYNAGTPETTVEIEYLIDSTLRIRSVNMNEVVYLIFENETFLGGPPSNRNDEFELVELNGNKVAFRVVRQNSSESGSGASEEDKSAKEQVQSSSESDEINNVQMESEDKPVSDCYLGFEDQTSEPKCYNSTEFEATFEIIDITRICPPYQD